MWGARWRIPGLCDRKAIRDEFFQRGIGDITCGGIRRLTAADSDVS